MRIGLIASALCALIFTSCSSTYWKLEKISRTDNLTLYLEHFVSGGEIVDEGYAHPCTFHVNELTEIFKGLTYHEPRLFQDAEETNVFFPEDAFRLAQGVAKILGSARSDQRIRFTSYNFGGGMLFSHQRKTEGVIFLKPAHQLNIAFVVINDDPPPDPIGGSGTDQDYLKTSKKNPVRITFTQAPLVPKKWYVLKPTEEEGKVHPLWAVVDLNTVREMFKDKMKAEVTPPPEPEVKPEKKAAESVPEAKEADDLKKKLQRLKEYFDEGLIDEEEYKEKKKQLLEGVTA
jgi:hypothetical protein